MRVPALVLAPGALLTPAGRIAHAVVRGGERFKISAVVDPDCEEGDAGSLLDGKHRGVPVTASLDEAIDESATTPEYCIIGMTTDDGRLNGALRPLVLEALKNGLPIINPLPQLLRDDAEIVATAQAHKAELIDLCAMPDACELPAHETASQSSIPRLAIFGTGTAVGKHTTARLLLKALRHAECRAELIYTGQTGWLQGGRWGLVLDALDEAEIAPALSAAISQCVRETRPEIVLVEGHSSRHALDDATLAAAAGAHYAILQHALDADDAIPVEDKLSSLHATGVEVLAISLRGENAGALEQEIQRLQQATELPVFCSDPHGMPPLTSLVLAWQGNGGKRPVAVDADADAESACTE